MLINRVLIELRKIIRNTNNTRHTPIDIIRFFFAERIRTCFHLITTMTENFWQE